MLSPEAVQVNFQRPLEVRSGAGDITLGPKERCQVAQASCTVGMLGTTPLLENP
jgi:hypothetical protein